MLIYLLGDTMDPRVGSITATSELENVSKKIDEGLN